MKKIAIQILSFPGFHNNQFNEREMEEYQRDNYQSDMEELKYINEWKLNYERYRKTVMKLFTVDYIDTLNYQLDIGIKIDEYHLESPAEYGTENDKILCTVKVKDYAQFISKLCNYIRHDRTQERLSEIIKSKHTANDEIYVMADAKADKWEQVLLADANSSLLNLLLWYLASIRHGERPDTILKWLKEADYDALFNETTAAEIHPATYRAKREYREYKRRLKEEDEY